MRSELAAITKKDPHQYVAMVPKQRPGGAIAISEQ